MGNEFGTGDESRVQRMRVYLILGLSLFLLHGAARSQITADKAIGLIDDVSAARLDPVLPHTPFLEWLKELLGPATKIEWELNDCGTLTGIPTVDNGRDQSYCMEGSIVLSPQGILGIAIFVGTERTGLTRSPRIANIFIEIDGNVVYFKRLSDLQQALRKVDAVNKKGSG